MEKHAMFLLLLSFIASFAQKPVVRPLNIAHRGSSGRLPEHTLEAYRLGVDDGADYIECDVCITKDLVPICRHESWLNHTTNVWNNQALRSKVKTYSVFSPSSNTTKNITDIFTVDLTLAEIKTIGVNQKYSFRDPSFNGLFKIPTLQEYIDVAKSANRVLGIYPEIKNPEWVNSLDILRDKNTTFEDVVLEVLHKNKYTKKDSPCYVQSFSEKSIRELKTKTELPLVKLFDYPFPEEKLQELSSICAGIGVWKNLIIPQRDHYLQKTTDLLANAHKNNLVVHTYTFRNEDKYLAWNYTQDPYNEYQKFFDLQVDGYFTDFPATLKRILDMKFAPKPKSCPSGVPGTHKGAYPVPALVLIVALIQKFHE